MQKQYDFLAKEINAGNTVLAYTRASKVKHVANLDRVAYRSGVVYVDGVDCTGYTFARKP